MIPRKPLWRKVLFISSSCLSLGLLLLLFLPGLNTSSSPTRLVIHRGTGFSAIVNSMQDNGTIAQSWPVLLAARIFPGLHAIKPGRYSIPPNKSIFGLLNFFHNHPQDEVRVTLPEGLTIDRVANIMEKKLDLSKEAFVKAASNPITLKKYKIQRPDAEGYLLPGTYNFPWASSADEAAALLIRHFRNFYTDSLRTMTSARGLSETELLTLASIVEAETPLNREKPVVASVYLNRLRKNMRLQADPTIQYAHGGTARRLSYRDLAIDSPYNTYRYSGLPPGPICNPGTAAILAVLQPADTSFLYFVATGTGGHNFATSLREHNINVKQYRKRRNTISNP